MTQSEFEIISKALNNHANVLAEHGKMLTAIQQQLGRVEKDVQEIRVILNIDQQIENLKTVRSA